MIRRLSVVLLGALALSLSAAPSVPRPSSAGFWYRYRLPGAEVKSLVADPATRGGFYLGTAQGGVYRTTDGGRSWTSPVGGAAFPGYAVTALVVDPLRNATLWAGLTGVVRGGLVARSDDRGETWTDVRRWPDRAGARALAVEARRGGRVIVAGGDLGLEISENDGRSWRPSQPPLDPGSGVSFVAFHPERPDLLFCGSFRHPFRSTDLGRTWARTASGMVEDTEVFVLDFRRDDPDEIWAATCGWVYRSTDGGANWVRFKEGMTDRRTHVVRMDPRDPSRILAGTTGGLFESGSTPRVFRRLGFPWVVNALAFDPNEPSRLLIGTESHGILRSEDGGLTAEESNQGLAESRISSIAETKSGRLVLARAADGPAGGLWSLDAVSGDAEKLPSSPPATVVALEAAGERLLAATPDGIFTADAPGSPFTLALRGSARGFVRGPDGLVLVATDEGVFGSKDGGKTWGRAGSLVARVDTVRRARFEGAQATYSADSGGKTLWWDGKDWVFRAFHAGGGSVLSGGFGRPRETGRWTPEPLGLTLDASRSFLVFRPEDDPASPLVLQLPEAGLNVSGWTGDPRTPRGLFVSTLGRGLFRYVPGGSPAETVDGAGATR